MSNNCDHCHQAVHPDVNGWGVGSEETSDCPKNDGGREVDSSARSSKPGEK